MSGSFKKLDRTFTVQMGQSAGTKRGGDVSGKFLQTQGLRFVWNPYEGKYLIFLQSDKKRTWSLLKDDGV